MKHTKPTRRLQTVLLRWTVAVLAVLMLCCIGASAEDLTIAEANKEARRAAERSLDDLIDAYQAMETDTHSDRWIGVELAIFQYGRNRLNELVKDERYQTDSLTVEIERYRASGAVAGEVTWVYYTYINQLAESRRANVTGVFETVCGEIGKVTLTSQTDITRSFGNSGFVSRMYVAIYDEMLDALLLDGDSQAVRGKVEAAKKALRADDCLPVVKEGRADTSDEAYRRIFDDCRKGVTVQRWQDAALACLEDVFAIICPDVSVNEHEGMQAALAALDDDAADTVAVLNERMTQTVSELLRGLDNLDGAYVDAYIAGLEAQMAEAVADANALNRIADIRSFFGDHAMTYAKAHAKDVLVAYIAEKGLSDDGKMMDLADTYNGKEGRFDTCGTQEAVDFEIDRAKLRVDLRHEYLYARDLIDEHGGEGAGKDELLDDIETEYLAADAKLATNNPCPTWEECLAIYKACIDEFDKATAEAEVVAFLTKHREIIKKTRDEVTLEDKEKLDAAISDLDALNDYAKEILATLHAEVAPGLAEKYQNVAVEQLETYLDEEPRTAFLNDLKVQVYQKELTGADPRYLAALVAEVDAIVHKAACIDCVYDTLDDLTGAEDYDSFSDARKQELQKIADDAVGALAGFKIENGAEAILGLDGIADKAILDMHRVAAYARLEAKAALREDQTDKTKDAVAALITEAFAAIAETDDPDRMAELTEDALFAIDKIYATQDMETLADTATDEILGKGFLPRGEADAYADRVKTLLEEAKLLLDVAANPAAVTAVVDGLNAQLEALLAEVEQADAVEAEEIKNDALTRAQAAYDEAVAHINGKVYLSEDDRAALLGRAEELHQTAKDQIEKATTSVGVQTAANALANGLTALKADVDAKDVETAEKLRSDADANVKARAEEIGKAIDGMMYVPDEEKREKKQAVADLVTAFEAQMAEADSPAEIEAVTQTTLEAMDSQYRAAAAKDLAEAKQDAINRLMMEQKEVGAVIDGYTYLDDESKAALANRREAWYADTVAAINAATTVEEVHNLRDARLADLDAYADMAQAMEDAACVRALTPVLIVLACILVVELLALGVLYLLRRRQKGMMQVAAYLPLTAVPVMALTMTPVAAWVLLVLLAVVDVALIPVIVWMAMQLWQNRIVVQLEEEEGIRILEEPIGSRRKELPDPGTVARLETPKLIYLMPPVEAMPEIVQAITVEEADELISDEDALNCEESGLEDTEVYHGRKKAEINIDVLSRFFEAGETITLNSMKKKGLLPRSVGHVKVLARGRLDKPITVIAQGFSASAVKMIVLTGGKAVLTEGAPERWTWRGRRKR